MTTEVSGSTPFRQPGIAARTRAARSALAPRWRFDAGQPCTVRDKEKTGGMRRLSFIGACLASVLLSLGTAGAPALASTRLVWGSVPDQVMRQAACPVLAVPPAHSPRSVRARQKGDPL